MNYKNIALIALFHSMSLSVYTMQESTLGTKKEETATSMVEYKNEFKARLKKQKLLNIALTKDRYSLAYNFPTHLRNVLLGKFPQIHTQLIENTFNEQWGFKATYAMDSAQPRETDKSYTWYETNMAMSLNIGSKFIDFKKPYLLTRPQASADETKAMLCSSDANDTDRSRLYLHIYDHELHHMLLEHYEIPEQYRFDHYAISNTSYVGLINMPSQEIYIFDPHAKSIAIIKIPKVINGSPSKVAIDFDQQANSIGLYMQASQDECSAHPTDSFENENSLLAIEEYTDTFEGNNVPSIRIWFITKIK